MATETERLQSYKNRNYSGSGLSVQSSAVKTGLWRKVIALKGLGSLGLSIPLVNGFGSIIFKEKVHNFDIFNSELWTQNLITE